jgi:hypothetical protein
MLRVLFQVIGLVLRLLLIPDKNRNEPANAAFYFRLFVPSLLLASSFLITLRFISVIIVISVGESCQHFPSIS